MVGGNVSKQLKSQILVFDLCFERTRVVQLLIKAEVWPKRNLK
jgi:hypothetical protein